MQQKNASVVIATYNRAGILEKTLNAMLDQNYPFNYEIIVINDASTDNTKQVLQKISKYKKIRFKNLEKNSGPAVARNVGIKMARYPILVIMDDDCIPDKNWLKKLVSGFLGNIGITTSFSIYGGTSTAFLKKVLDRVGYFDQDFPFAYREDTELVFRVLDTGYKVKFIRGAKFKHLHEPPKTLKTKTIYILKRIWMHSVDPLLYKKHPERTKEFFNIKLGIVRHPIEDFKNVTGLWPQKRKKFSLSSPQGIVFLQPKTIFHEVLVFLGGFFYTIAVKLIRLYGSIKYKKLLI